MAGRITPEEWHDFKRELEAKSAEAEATLGRLSSEPPPSAEQVVTGTVDALAIVRLAISAGEVERVRASLERLFESFLIERLPADFTELADLLPHPQECAECRRCSVSR
jgi:hypothetical protein